MRHVEFFVLWDDGTWSVEAVDVTFDDDETLEEMITNARQVLRRKARSDARGLRCLGPLFAVETKS